MTFLDEIQKERVRLTQIFDTAPDSVRVLAETMIEDAAFLKVENARLRAGLVETGTVRVHPQRPELQKPVASAVQMLKNAATLAALTKALASLARSAADGGEDELDKFLREARGADE